VSAGCLPGVERGRLLDAGLLQERELTVEDVRRADALAVVSSLRGWRDAVLV
jgi:para-aminobenzoate synthetase/4-amino-4-deoxychorismate lyase